MPIYNRHNLIVYDTDDELHLTPCVIMQLFSSYHADDHADDVLDEFIDLAIQGNKRFILAKAEEPNMMWEIDHGKDPADVRFIFDIIHGSLARTGFPPENFRFVSGNMSVQECYTGWADQNGIPTTDRINVLFHNRWLSHVIQNTHSHVDCTDDPDRMRDKYFSCLNRTFRHQKGEVLIKMIDQKFFDTYDNKFVYSFAFGYLEPLSDIIVQNPGIEKYFKKLDDDRTYESIHRSSYTQLITDEYIDSITDTYFDFVIDFVDYEDIGRELMPAYKAVHPWFKERIISEKVMRCILHRKPHIVYTDPGSLKLFNDTYGFKSFDGVLFDESYDDIQDHSERQDAILNQLASIMDGGLPDLHDKVFSKEVQDIIDYNYNQLCKLYKIAVNSTGIFHWLETYSPETE